MRAETRHQLKQDRFSQATFGAAEATVHWTVEHKTKLIAGAAVVAVVFAASFGGWYYLNQQDQKASLQLNQAVRTLDTSVRPAGAPADPTFPSFASAKDRATEARKQFQAIADSYPHTRTAEFARYFLGLTSSQLGDNADGSAAQYTAYTIWLRWRRWRWPRSTATPTAPGMQSISTTRSSQSRLEAWARLQLRWAWPRPINPPNNPPKPNAFTSRYKKKIPALK